MKRVILAGGTAAMTLILASTLVAGAQTTTTTPTPAPAHPEPMVVRVNAAGHILLRGTISSIGSGALTVKSWGGDWTVNVPSSAEVLPGGDMSKFKQGDLVGVLGIISQSGNWTVDAKVVRDWTLRTEVNTEVKQNQKETRQMMQRERPRVYQGTASAVTGSSFTLTSAKGTAYTVNVTAGTKFLNKKWLSIAAADIQNGDTIRVFGVNASGTISATVVRDVSLPR